MMRLQTFFRFPLKTKIPWNRNCLAPETPKPIFIESNAQSEKSGKNWFFLFFLLGPKNKKKSQIKMMEDAIYLVAHWNMQIGQFITAIPIFIGSSGSTRQLGNRKRAKAVAEEKWNACAVCYWQNSLGWKTSFPHAYCCLAASL